MSSCKPARARTCKHECGRQLSVLQVARSPTTIALASALTRIKSDVWSRRRYAAYDRRLDTLLFETWRLLPPCFGRERCVSKRAVGQKAHCAADCGGDGDGGGGNGQSPTRKQ